MESIDMGTALPLSDQQHPGARLRTAREAAGYSIQDISVSIKISAQIIEALESEDVAKLPSRTFTHGYLRSYGKLLKLPVDELITAFPSLPDAPQVMPLPRRPKPAVDLNRSNTIIKYGASVASVLLGLWLLLFLMGKNQPPETPPQTVSGPVAQTPPVTPTALPESPKPPVKIQTAIPPATPTRADSMAAKSVTSVPSVPSADKPAETAAPLGSVSGTVPLPVAETPVAEIPGIETPAAETPPAETASTEAAKITVVPQSAIDPKLPNIQLMFNGDCWVDIMDAQGRRLVYELGKFPMVKSVRGKAPFTIILGNARNVNVSYRGEDIDITKGRANAYVHTTLGQDSDNAAAESEPLQAD